MPINVATSNSDHLSATMTACRIARFGGPDVLALHDLPRPVPAAGEVLVRVKAAGVGPWDALIRSGGSALVTSESLPITLGSDLSGIVEAVGEGVDGFERGDAVYGVTNRQFTGAYAEFALAEAHRLSSKPQHVDFIVAAGVPVVAATAWQMLFDHARLQPGQTVLVLGGAGSVGGFAVQLAHLHGAHVIATASPSDRAAVSSLGADSIIDVRDGRLEHSALQVDAVIDTAGGKLQSDAWTFVKRGGCLVSAVSVPDPARATSADVRSAFFYVDVDTSILERITALLDRGSLSARVGAVLPLGAAREAHEMLDRTRPRPAGKIVLAVDD